MSGGVGSGGQVRTARSILAAVRSVLRIYPQALRVVI